VAATEALLQYCTSRSATLYIVIDSLDEFENEERNILLRVLSSVISCPDSRAKLFLVGRGSVLATIRHWFLGFHEKSTDCDEVEIDIETYTRENIALRQEEEFPIHERLVLEDPTMAQHIIEVLIKDANGM
jgi:hypothetical protein